MSVTIQNALTFGGGLTLHTEYQLNVAFGNESWMVYRRFKDFEKLHKSLLSFYPIQSNPSIADEQAETRSSADQLPVLKFPEKSYLGSYLSATSTTTQERKKILQEYLQTICNSQKLRDSIDFLNFIDNESKGESGIAKYCGQDNIMKEVFASCKLSFLGSWSVCYLVLMKDGTLYVLRSIYDSPDRSMVNWNLKGGEIRVVPKAKNNTISITSTTDDRKLTLSLSSPTEAAFWIRTISDLSLESNAPPASRTAVSNTKSPQSQNSSSTKPAKPQAVVVRAQGTGNTTDELSSMYGI